MDENIDEAIEAREQANIDPMSRTIVIPPFAAWIGIGDLHADDEAEARRVMGILFPDGGWDIESDGEGSWLVAFPVQHVTDILFSGGYWRHAVDHDGLQYNVEVELP